MFFVGGKVRDWLKNLWVRILYIVVWIIFSRMFCLLIVLKIYGREFCVCGLDPFFLECSNVC